MFDYLLWATEHVASFFPRMHGVARDVEGRVEIPERSVAFEPGAIFGEMALFTQAGLRTASAICGVSDVKLLVVTYKQFEQLYFQNPEFGLYLAR